MTKALWKWGGLGWRNGGEPKTNGDRRCTVAAGKGMAKMESELFPCQRETLKRAALVLASIFFHNLQKLSVQEMGTNQCLKHLALCLAGQLTKSQFPNIWRFLYYCFLKNPSRHICYPAWLNIDSACVSHYRQFLDYLTWCFLDCVHLHALFLSLVCPLVPPSALVLFSLWR